MGSRLAEIEENKHDITMQILLDAQYAKECEYHSESYIFNEELDTINIVKNLISKNDSRFAVFDDYYDAVEYINNAKNNVVKECERCARW